MKQQVAVAIGLAMVMCWGGGTASAQSASAVINQSAVTNQNIDQSLINLDTAQTRFKQDQRADQRDEDSRQREMRAEEEAELPEAQLPTPDVRRDEASLFNDHKDVSHDTDDLHRLPR